MPIPNLCTTICGDGLVAGNEVCDDGFVTGGCTAGCMSFNLNWICTGGSATGPSWCRGMCGDSFILAAGGENCDDGNSNSGDGCSGSCTVENGYTCTGLPSVCTTTCGDGKRAGIEVCDDGTDNGIGCASGCNGWASGYSCTGGSPTVADVCTACTSCPTPWWIPSTSSSSGSSNSSSNSSSTSTAVCGNGVKESGEDCDDGNNIDNDGCSPTCSLTYGYFGGEFVQASFYTYLGIAGIAVIGGLTTVPNAFFFINKYQILMTTLMIGLNQNQFLQNFLYNLNFSTMDLSPILRKLIFSSI
jgi:cysteine-rich repeat protein